MGTHFASRTIHQCGEKVKTSVKKIRDALQTEKVKRTMTMVGLVFMNLPGGMASLYGNLLTYTDSYLKVRVGQDPSLCARYIYGLMILGWSVGVTFYRKVFPCLGTRGQYVLSVLVYDLSLLLCYFSVQHSATAVIINLGIVQGFWTGATIAMSFTYFSMWVTEENVGVLTSLVTNTSLGPLVWNVIITNFINPHDDQAVQVTRERAYFVQDALLDRVPYIFVLISGTGLLCHAIGLALIHTKTEEDQFSRTSHEYVIEKDVINNTGSKESNLVPSKTSKPNGSCGHHEKSALASRTCTQKTNFYSRQEDESSVHQNKQTVEDFPAAPSTNECTSHTMKLGTMDQEKELSFYDIARSREFLSIWIGTGCSVYAYATLEAFYKMFCQRTIHDDKFYTIVGPFEQFTVIAGRLLWGALVDRFGSKMNSIACHAMIVVTMSFYFFIPPFGKIPYIIWVVLTAFSTIGVYGLYPVVVYHCFGKRHLSAVYGLTTTSMVLASLTFTFLTGIMLENFGWSAVFLTAACINVFPAIGNILALPNHV